MTIERIISYLELYKENHIHGEFLLDFIRFNRELEGKNINPKFERAIEDFLGDNEFYESSTILRSSEDYLTGDEKLLESVLKLQNALTGKKSYAGFLPKSITEEKNPKKVLFKYVELYRKAELEEDDYLFFLLIFFSMHCDLNRFNQGLNSKELKQLKKIKNIFNTKNLSNINAIERREIHEFFSFLEKNYLSSS